MVSFQSSQGGQYCVVSDTVGDGTPVRRRFRPGRWLIVAGVALLVGLLAVSLWISYTRSPSYSAQKLIEAVNRGDSRTISKHFDRRAVTRDLYDAAVADVSPDAAAEQAWLIEEIAGAAESVVVDVAADEVSEAILTGSAGDALVLWDREKATLTRQGDSAILRMPTREDRPILFELRSRGAYWQVVGVENAGDVYPMLMKRSGLPLQ